jgi:uncharacterized protein YkwD
MRRVPRSHAARPAVEAEANMRAPHLLVMDHRLARPVVLACTLAGCLWACTTARPPAGAFGEAPVVADSVPGEAALEAEMHRLVDAAREAAGLAPLAWDPILATLARAHSQDMIAAGFVGHGSPTTGSPEDRLHRAGYLARLSAENVAVHQSVEGAHAGLMESPGHRANILEPGVTAVGIGIVARAGDLFVTQLFADPASIEDPAAVARTLEARVNAARQAAGLPPLSAHAGLQLVVDEGVRAMPVPLTAEPLDRAGRAALEVAAGDADLGGIAISAQTALGEADLTLPAPALGPEAVALAVAGSRTEGEGGRPTLVLLVVIGTR